MRVCVVQLRNLWVNGCDFPKTTQLRIAELLLLYIYHYQTLY